MQPGGPSDRETKLAVTMHSGNWLKRRETFEWLKKITCLKSITDTCGAEFTNDKKFVNTNLVYINVSAYIHTCF